MRRWLIILFVFVLFFTAFEISESFSLFESAKDIVVNNDIGRWQIKVNEGLVSESVSFNVSNVKVSSDENVRADHFAPGTEGYFEIVIDPNETDVSIYYEIVCRDDMITNTQIHLTGVENNDDNLVLVAPYTYAGIIPLSDIENKEVTTVKFYVEWINNENNNEIDSLYGLSTANFEIPMEITLRQYTGETIVEYVGNDEEEINNS